MTRRKVVIRDSEPYTLNPKPRSTIGITPNRIALTIFVTPGEVKRRPGVQSACHCEAVPHAEAIPIIKGSCVSDLLKFFTAALETGIASHGFRFAMTKATGFRTITPTIGRGSKFQVPSSRFSPRYLATLIPGYSPTRNDGNADLRPVPTFHVSSSRCYFDT